MIVVATGSIGSGGDLFGRNDAATVNRAGRSVVCFHHGNITKSREMHHTPRRCAVVCRSLFIGWCSGCIRTRRRMGPLGIICFCGPGAASGGISFASPILQPKPISRFCYQLRRFIELYRPRAPTSRRCTKRRETRLDGWRRQARSSRIWWSGCSVILILPRDSAVEYRWWGRPRP